MLQFLFAWLTVQSDFRKSRRLKLQAPSAQPYQDVGNKLVFFQLTYNRPRITQTF